ncbi:hypothetical protein PR048_032809 [Dryococelus australis]|uniref:Uncharacterized protein n=1 Tax=Dryococelus australis TaxID=614101 RepID=A0ABQ9G392_9NEOP|nr:hypothetical protein PR048_032809 [Dryococelus australis]
MGAKLSTFFRASRVSKSSNLRTLRSVANLFNDIVALKLSGVVPSGCSTNNYESLLLTGSLPDSRMWEYSPEYAAGRRVFSGSHFPSALSFRFILNGSQDLYVCCDMVFLMCATHSGPELKSSWTKLKVIKEVLISTITGDGATVKNLYTYLALSSADAAQVGSVYKPLSPSHHMRSVYHLNGGWRKMHFEEARHKTKKRRVVDLLVSSTHEKLVFASEISLRSEGRRDTADMVKQVSNFSPKRAIRLKKAYTSADRLFGCRTKLMSEQALGLLIDANSSKRPNDIEVGHNSRHYSTRYCRLVKIKFQKETSDLTRQEVEKNWWVMHHKLLLTMIDGKVSGALTQTSSTLCYICKAKPSEMNNLDKHVERVRDLPTLTYELCTSIPGINVELIQRFAIIVRAISADLEINAEAFLYMPPIVHKVLIHWEDVIKHAFVPIGLLNEEVLEARNKYHTGKLPLEVTELLRDPLVCGGGEEEHEEEDAIHHEEKEDEDDQ